MKKTTPTKADRTRRKYDDTFKQQALQLLRLGQSVPAVAQALGISEGVLYKWKQATRASATDQELEQLRKPLKQVETERDILKKCMAPPCESTAEFKRRSCDRFRVERMQQMYPASYV